MSSQVTKVTLYYAFVLDLATPFCFLFPRDQNSATRTQYLEGKGLSLGELAQSTLEYSTNSILSLSS